MVCCFLVLAFRPTLCYYQAPLPVVHWRVVSSGGQFNQRRCFSRSNCITRILLSQQGSRRPQIPPPPVLPLKKLLKVPGK